MRTLAIDCATEGCSVALFDGAALIAGDFRMLGRGHAEQLVPMIRDLPQRGRAERIAVARGPGSFTGVRVGLAAARALALAWGAELVGYPTLALVAAMARHEDEDGPVAVAMTGGHGEWFVAAYEADGGVLRGCASLAPAAAVVATPEALVAGSQAEALVAARGYGRALALWPDARQVMLIEDGLSAATAPIYGRPPDAKIAAARAAT